MIKNVISLIRVRQWYKNLLILLPLFFSGLLLEVNLFYYVAGFFALSFVSSASYVINDLKDVKEDRNHPEKKFRPLASNKIKKQTAIILASSLLIIGLFSGFLLGLGFFLALVLLFILTQLYIFWLKNIAFLDIILISSNFLIRTLSGAYIAVSSKNLNQSIQISPWLILCIFFLALFLTASKREADLNLLKNKASLHKKSFEVYTKEMCTTIANTSLTLLLATYSIYLVLVHETYFLITLPIALFAILRYLYLTKSNNIISRHPEYFYKDKQFLISVIIFGLLMLVLIYLL